MQLAEAGSIVMSLWTINDKFTGVRDSPGSSKGHLSRFITSSGGHTLLFALIPRIIAGPAIVPNVEGCLIVLGFSLFASIFLLPC